ARDWGRILDVGCGDGLFFDQLSRLGVVEGVEPDGALVAADGRWRERIAVRPFDAGFTPDRRYGLILFLDVLEHMEDPRAALRHAAGLLDRDGRVVITVPASMLLWSGHDVLNRHYLRYDRKSLVELVRSAGMTVEQVRHVFHWAYFAKLLARFAESALRRGPRPPAVPPAVVNRALYALTRAEQRTLGRLRPPFGSSLLLVARPR
ncbi:MAG TPA: class I SAM-dependent methyltransferase, partial [Thermoanaerobaculia bacterium]